MVERNIEYTPEGVCSKKIQFDYVDGIIENVKFTGGCKGNVVGIARLSEGRKAIDILNLCKDIKCKGDKSCPQQLATAIEKFLNEKRI